MQQYKETDPFGVRDESGVADVYPTGGKVWPHLTRSVVQQLLVLPLLQVWLSFVRTSIQPSFIMRTAIKAAVRVPESIHTIILSGRRHAGQSSH